MRVTVAMTSQIPGVFPCGGREGIYGILGGVIMGQADPSGKYHRVWGKQGEVPVV